MEGAGKMKTWWNRKPREGPCFLCMLMGALHVALVQKVCWMDMSNIHLLVEN